MGLELASYRRRVGGSIIDEIIVLLPIAITLAVTGFRPGDDLTRTTLVVLEVAMVLVGFTYEAVMIGLLGRTVGKFATGTRVVRADTGGRLGWFSSVQRAMVPAVANGVPALGVLLSALVYVPAFFDPLRRGLHDRAAGSLVVRHGVVAPPAT
ncbi:MAG: RDD family protein [Ilumatobacteraceae bacterium]